MRSVQDSVLPWGVGLRKPHISPLSRTQNPKLQGSGATELRTSNSELQTAAQPLTRTAHGGWGGDLLLTGEGGMVYSFGRITL